MRPSRQPLLMTILIAAMCAGCSSGGMRPGLSDAVRDYSKSLRVIPGIEGFGVDTPAGRGGQIVRVTNLNPSGEGSLQKALQTPGPRVVVFEVGGIIDMRDALVVSHPFITVAGETAPAPGITIIGAGIIINTHDVLLRHVRCRVGDRTEGPAPDARDGISVLDNGDRDVGVCNVIIDHCSVSWALDEGMSIWGSNIADVTFSRCIIAENLSRSLHPEGEHSKGLLVGDNARRIAVVGNLFAHNMERNPFIKGNVSALIAHNVIYNPGTAAIHFGDVEGSGPSLGTVIGNALVPGPDTRRLLPLVRLQMDMHPETRVYALNNDAGGRALKRTLWAWRNWHSVPVYDAAPVRVKPLAQRTPEETLEWVLRTAGARPRERDAVDARIVETLRRGEGNIIDSIGCIGGFPSSAPVNRPLTLPDAPHDTSDNGYTNLENWLREFANALE